MNRTLLAAITAALFIAPLRADDKPAEKKSRAECFKELRDDLQKLMPDVIGEWRKAGSDAERNKALAKLDPILERGYNIVAEAPKDETSLNVLLQLVGAKPEPPEKVLDLLAEHHIDSPRIASLSLRFAGNTSPSAIKFLRAASAKSHNNEVKGSAMFAYGQTVHQQAEEEKDANKSAELNHKAEDLLASAARDYGDVSVGRGTIKKEADKVLFEIRNLSIGKAAPEVVSKDLDDKAAKLSELKGKVVVLDIWATWCSPCRQMIPHEREMVEKLKDKPFKLISVSADDEKKTLVDFLKEEKMPWTHWWEGRHEGGIIHDWNVRFFPTIYVIDAKGLIRYKNVRGKQLEEAVEKLLDEVKK
jgi:thiol-disulfide isomerase/thioredoxin